MRESEKRISGPHIPVPRFKVVPPWGRLPSDTKIWKEGKKRGKGGKSSKKVGKRRKKGERERIKQVKQLEEKSSENIYFVKKGVFFLTNYTLRIFLDIPKPYILRFFAGFF